jgi:quercetin dioxygenase-like cupin family protein
MPEPITRTILERFDVPDSGYETVIMLVEMEPHVNSGLHTHPGFDAA